MKQIFLPQIKHGSPRTIPTQPSSFICIILLKRAILCFVILQINMLACVFVSYGQEIELTGRVVNSNQEPVSKVRISLQSLPDRYCYSDQYGNFSFAESITTAIGTQDLKANNKSICFFENGRLLIDAKSEPLHISIIDIMGRNMGTIAHEKNLNGKYEICPSAYIQNLPKGIYLAHVRLGSYQKGFKFNNFTHLSSSEGLHYIGSSSLSLDEKNSLKLKYATYTKDTIIFEHDFYKTTQVFASNLNADIGIVQLENFGDYSIPTNMKPDKADLYSTSGNVINLLGKDSSEFTIYFNPYSTFDKKLSIRAIPIDNLNRLAPGIELISAIHLEPRGTKFNLPAHVSIVTKDIPITDSLVVFLYDDITNKTYFIPYTVYSSYNNNSIVFSLSHFSDIGIGYQPEIPEESGELLTSDDFINELNYQISIGNEVPDDFFTLWYQQIVLKAIDAVTNMTNLRDAIAELSLLSTYINYWGKEISEFSFYDELKSSLQTKINNIFKGFNNWCESVSLRCTKLDLAILANRLVQLTQQLPGMEDNPLNISDICNGEILEFICDFKLKKEMADIKVSETIQIPYFLYDVFRKEIDSEGIDPKFEWYSEDPNIASVNQEGIITGKNKGTVTVLARYCDIERSVLVNVEEDLNYCKADTNIYSGTVNIYLYDYNGNVYLEKMILNTTIKITANLKEGTFTGYVFTHDTYVYNKWVNALGRWVYDRTENQISNKPYQPPHRLGKVECDMHRQLYNLDEGYKITIYPQSKIIMAWDSMYRSGVGVLVKH